jgi:hypothetical protein
MRKNIVTLIDDMPVDRWPRCDPWSGNRVGRSRLVNRAKLRPAESSVRALNIQYDSSTSAPAPSNDQLPVFVHPTSLAWSAE